MAACECIVELDQDNPIKAGKKRKIAKHTASVTFRPVFAANKKPKCKGQGCERVESYKWSLTKTDYNDKLELFQDDADECLVVGRGEFKLTVTVTVKCYHAEETDPDEEDDPGIFVGTVSSCESTGSDTFQIHVR